MIRILSILLFLQLFLSGFSQEFNQIVHDEDRQKDILVGELTMDGIMGSVFGEYYFAEFDPYQPDKQIIKSLVLNLAPDFQYTIVLGTWCGDSKREVPRMLKVLTEAGIELDDIKLYAVDFSKEASDTPVGTLNIQKVPTLIVFRDNLEIGRIIETPVKSIEEDVLGIIGGK